jgi:hypothetical protein
MDLAEARRRLESALPLRVPLMDPNKSPGERISELEDYILQTAWHRAELEEALVWVLEAGKVLRLQWDGVKGWEVSVRGSRPTQAQVEAAKAEIDPATHKALQEARFLVEALRRQITRLGGSDYDAASRAYTLLSGS